MNCTKNCNDKIFTLEQIKTGIQIFGQMPSLRAIFIVRGSKTVKCAVCGKVHKLNWIS